MDMNLSKHQEMVKDREAWHAAVPGVTKSRTWLSNWTTQQQNVGMICRVEWAILDMRQHSKILETWVSKDFVMPPH